MYNNETLADGRSSGVTKRKRNKNHPNSEKNWARIKRPARASRSAVMAGAPPRSWFKDSPGHQQAADMANDVSRPGQRSRRLKRAVDMFHDEPTDVPGPQGWLRHQDMSAPLPPKVTRKLLRAIAVEAVGRDPNKPFGPATAELVTLMAEWQKELKDHFGHSKSCYAKNTRRAAQRIKRRISFLGEQRTRRIMKVITEGYLIPFVDEPPPFHRKHNSPDLLQHKEQAWKAKTGK